MTSKRIIRPSTGYGVLRARGVLREGELRDLLFERSSGKRPRDLRHLPADLLAATPMLAADLTASGGFRPRRKTGSPSDALRRYNRFEAMRRQAGLLVLVTAVRHDLAGLPLKDAGTLKAWKDGHIFMLDRISPGVLAFDGVLQAGGKTGGLHDHTVLPFNALQADLQAFAATAPHGAGGGAIHPESGLHFVLMGDTSKDRKKVAGYLARDPDGRFDLPDLHPDYLQAHEDALLRKASGVQAPSLKHLRLPRAWR